MSRSTDTWIGTPAMNLYSKGPSKFLIVASTPTRRSLLRDLLKQHCPECEVLESEDTDAAVNLAQKYGSDLSETILELADCGQEQRRVRRFISGLDIRYELENDSSLIPSLICQLLENITSLRLLDDSQLVPISVALSESLSNAIHHGNLELDSELRQEDESIYYELAEARKLMWPYCERRVHVLGSYSKERVKFVIRDDGPGFNTKKVEEPAEDDTEYRIGGRGLMMIRAFMDIAAHNEKGNEITLVKYSSAGQALLAEFKEPQITIEPLETIASI